MKTEKEIMLEIRISTKDKILAEITAPVKVLNNKATQDQIILFLRRTMQNN